MHRPHWQTKQPPLLLPVSPTPSMLGKSDFREHRLPLFTDPKEDQPGLQQPILIEQVLTRHPIFNIIFSCLSPAQLLRFARTSRLSRNAISLFFQRAYNINRHLLRFISDPIGFRSLQARTGTIISGSNALQFLDRTLYPESDLDVYTHPGHTREVGLWLIHREGYTFMPTESQGNPDFSALDWPEWEPWDMTLPRDDIDEDDMHIQDYRFTGFNGIYDFEKPCPSGGPALRLQVIDAEHTPMQCLFGYHSTCVMNLISYNAVYSLYPRATFEERSSLCLAKLEERDMVCLSKYATRGWRSISYILIYARDEEDFYLDRHRFVGDGLCWVVPLDMAGVDPPPALSPVSERFDWDPVQFNSWVLTRQKGEIFVAYHVLKPTLFRYTYLFADIEMIYQMMGFLQGQGSFEHRKNALVPVEQRSAAWSWWDAMLPEYVRKYLKKFDVEEMDTTDG